MKKPLQKIIIWQAFLFLTINFCEAQIINTFAGTGLAGYSGDGGAAISAAMNYPTGIAFDASGNMYIADTDNQRIRKIDISGIISTFAGSGGAGYGGDGSAATSAQLNYPTGVAVDASGNVYIADQGNNRIRKVDLAGIISTFAGTGVAAFGGDGGSAINSQLYYPRKICIDAANNLYIADALNHRIRKINNAGIISTFAGTGVSGFSGDGGAAGSAQLKFPLGVAIDLAGNVYIADNDNFRIRKVNTSGIISTLAGSGIIGYAGDGGAATSAQLKYPCDVAVDASGNIFISDNYNQRVRVVNTGGIISTFAGTGIAGLSGDGSNSNSAQLNWPQTVAFDASYNLYISEKDSYRIRKITVPVGIKQFSANTIDYLIYPNPNNGSFKIKADEIKNGSLVLINSFGQKVYEQKIIEGANEINASGLSIGLYNCILLQDKQQINNCKLIVE